MQGEVTSGWDVVENWEGHGKGGMPGCTDQPQPKPQIKQQSGGREGGGAATSAHIACSLEFRVRLRQRSSRHKSAYEQADFFITVP